MNNEYRNICEIIVKYDFCIGCGLCAGVCPVQVLKMDFNSLGEYQPIEFKEGCLPTCNLCLDVCPFWDHNENEDVLADSLYAQEPLIDHCSETGFFLKNFVGYANSSNLREQGASGGILTWFLETMLIRRVVDNVICVGSNSDTNRLFKYKVCTNAHEIREASRSSYYPVELSETIQYILANEGRYVITGVPCYIKGIRLAMKRFPKLRRRIVLLCGLVCAQTQSKLFAEQLCRLKGGDPKSLVNATFRIKDPMRPANDYGFQFKCREGSVKEGKVFFSEGLGELWSNGYFTPNACNFCDDVFAETADITFMDAWLPEYQKDPKGHNLIIVRSEAALNILIQGMVSQELVLTPIPVDQIIQSQAGGIKRKRKILAIRISEEGKKQSGYIPRKRTSSLDGLEIEEKILYHLRKNLRNKYRENLKKDPTFPPHTINNIFNRLQIFLILKFSFFFKKFRKISKIFS